MGILWVKEIMQPAGRKGQNDGMNEQVAYALINLELARLEKCLMQILLV